ncbi:hypothetical protein FOZ76_11030 [Verticiella sediminum]|uniref:Uncharacterized protein n=1 Tax=Verticiella sediminum TaxID=1247510 RepID=A0A556AQ42_9BURK|nr:hypothetical protein [Verticiella sediminum]TSH95003.1 hypothetical protein FOZ76_11030 [Verticiella sediminum]
MTHAAANPGRAARHAGRAPRAAGQVLVEALVIGALLALLLFAPAWGDGERGMAGVWLRALAIWYGRFAAALALPV